MNIEELIEKLREYDPEMRVVVDGVEARRIELDHDNSGNPFIEIL